MYINTPLLPYADGMFSIMPPGLPARFYPPEESRKHVSKDYVICFSDNVPDDIKQRIIKDYADIHKKEIENSYYG